MVNDIEKLNLNCSFGEAPIICFDMDGVICEDTLGSFNDLSTWTEIQWEAYFFRCKPIHKTIAIMKHLNDLGCRIKIYTARPSRFTEITVKWLIKWVVYYDDLKMNKPAADVYIDDKGLRFTSPKELIENLQKNLHKGEHNV